jgi:small subunit ribosomal protein S6
MFLFDANVASRDWPGLERHVGDMLEKHGAKLVYSERWPDRKLAYELRGVKKGTYYLTYFEGPTTAIVGLQRDCQLSDRVLRLMVIQDEGIREELERRRARHEANEQPAATDDGAAAPAKSAGEVPAAAVTSPAVTSPAVTSPAVTSPAVTSPEATASTESSESPASEAESPNETGDDSEAAAS